MDWTGMRCNACQRLGVIASSIFACLVLTVNAAHAAAIPWPAKARFQYVAQKKELRELLREFAASEGISVSIAEGIQGSVSGKFDLAPQAMLDLLASSYGFIWYYDGSLLHISPSSSVRTEILQLHYSTINQLQAALAKLNILDHRFPLHVDTDGETVVVSGPERYVELVSQVSSNLEGRRRRSQETEIRVFPLRFAWAADHDFSSAGNKIVMPGVATVLRGMYHRNDAGRGRRNLSGGMPRKQIAMQSMSSTYTDANGDQDPLALAKPGAPANRVLNSPASEPEFATDQLPIIEADSRLNAVLVRDIPARMKQYEELIKTLDVRPPMIEIEARIIEIASDAAQNLGVDWRLNHTPTPNAGNSLQRLSNVREFMAGGGAFKAVLQNAGLNLLERISLLAQQGKANVISSPSVLTLNNLEARMDNQETFYVRVAGYQSAELFNISTGVTLHVTPLIVEEGAEKKIKLDVRIEDGRIDTQVVVDQIPTIKRSEINTQGFVSDGQALLIAGYSVEQQATNQSNVPGLSDVPVFGSLFRSDATKNSKIQRMYLLTPRIVDTGSNTVPERKGASTNYNRELGIAGLTLKMDGAMILQNMNKADTPGTNVISQGANLQTATVSGGGRTGPASDNRQANDADKTRDAKPASVDVVSDEKIGRWGIDPSDTTVKAVLMRWAQQDGWQLSWELDVDYPIEARSTINGTFEQAIEAVAKSMEQTKHPMRVILYSANKVVRVVAKGSE
ncbi:MAG TPA: type III secretion system outer membrane ring subunit SctC [Noviherbaspirillum sp.]|nr:type III secretion system outer membrane ring subunit SctC [Noviherbaspirillum sp.]